MIFIKIARFTLKLFILSISIIALYLLVAHTLIFLPMQKGEISTYQKSQKIYILYNEMHSDIVIETDSLNSLSKRYLSDVIQGRDGYLTFGWGDRDTYLNTPTWSDIELSTTLKALFINTPSVLHVTFYKDIKRFKNLKKIQLSKIEKKVLIESIFKSFNRDIWKHQGYGKDDYFYSSIHNYNIFNTCNTWTGKKLRDANISVSYWTPFSYNIIDSLP